MSELPIEKRENYRKKYKLPENYIEVLVQNKKRTEYFERAADLGQKHDLSAKMIAGVMINQHLDQKYEEPARLVEKLKRLTTKEYASEDEVTKIVTEVVLKETKAVGDFKSGKENVLGFLIGIVQKKLKGRGNVIIIKEKILKALHNN